ncbi:MAG: phosphoglucosamine mutase, partial [Steroidobacteraceae bacterium]
AGVNVMLIGPLPTPGIAYMTRRFNCDFGVVISASHNRYDDNGIKFFDASGAKLSDELEERIETELAQPPVTRTSRSLGRAVRVDKSRTHYQDFCASTIPPGTDLGGLKIVIDCANGAAYKLGPELFRSLGADVVSMGVSPDGRNINAGCGSLHLEGLQKCVVAERARLGVAFDGDADRALFVCETGKIVNGDGVLLAVARHLKSQNKLKGNRVVATSMSNLGLERVLAREGISLARASVGDRYVLEEMLRSGNVIGGEQSGHIIFLDDSPAGDGLLTAVKIASLVSMRGKIESLVEGLKDYPQIIVNVKVKSKPPLETLPEVSRALSEAQSALGENGRVVLRYSGTEQLARVLVEAEHDSDVQRFSQALANALRSSIGA